MDVSIIIVNYNTKNLLYNCLVSIFEQTKDIIFEVLVSDNASTDGSVEMIKLKFPQVNLIENKSNLGFGAANNRGLNIAKGEYIFYLNSDTVLLNNAVKIFYDYFEVNKLKVKIGVLGTNLLNDDLTPGYSYAEFFTYGKEIIFFLRRWLAVYYHGMYKIFTGHFKRNRIGRLEPTYGTVNIVIGAAMFMKNDGFAKFDERYFMYHEETDMQLQKYRAGYKSLLIEGPKIIHFGGMSSESSNNYFSHIGKVTTFYDYYSKMLYLRKNMPSKINIFIIKFFIVLMYFNTVFIKKTWIYLKKIIVA
jgi:GT2 family glycosyltransferase